MAGDASAAAGAPSNDGEVERLREKILRNPSVVLNDDALMRALLAASQRDERQIVDLRGAAIDRLERRLGALTAAHRDVVAAAWDNMSGMEQIHRAALAVLDAKTFEAFLDIVSIDFTDLLTVDVARFCLVVDAGEHANEATAALVADAPQIVVLSTDALDAATPTLDPSGAPAPTPRMGGPVRLLSQVEADPAIFGDDAARINSTAFIRLDFGPAIHPGLMAFGAVDPTRFDPEQGVDLLSFLGGVVERAMRDWLALGR